MQQNLVSDLPGQLGLMDCIKRDSESIYGFDGRIGSFLRANAVKGTLAG